MTQETKDKIKATKEANKAEGKKQVKPETNSDEKLDAVLSGINTLAGAIGKLIELQTVQKEEIAIDSSSKKSPVFTPSLDDETYPQNYVPAKFRKMTDEILSPEFGIKIVDFTDRTDFQLNIIVPEKYSSVSPSDRAKGVEDIRSRMIPRALGENGVKEWCLLIRSNLNRFYTKEGVASPFSTVSE